MNHTKRDASLDLDIRNYSFHDILHLFDLSFDFSLEELKRAKKKVLMVHPDKSKLPPEYFLFYKKAFDAVVAYYETTQKTQQPVEPKKYDTQHDVLDKRTQQKIQSNIAAMKTEEFNQTFNNLFEKNMVKKENPEKNAWFSKDEPLLATQEKVSTANMAAVFESLKTQTKGLVQYRGVQVLSNDGGASDLYDDDEDKHAYVSCNPFSKLKYDDLRKVHKDQTVFAVSESDYAHVPKYNSVDQYQRTRNQEKPMEKTHATQILEEQERTRQERMAKKRFEDIKQTQQFEEKNKSILSRFLHLGNS
jgi:hypothetical protein